MGYVTIRDLRLALTGVTDPSVATDYSTAASLPDANLNDAIDEAESVVDNYLRGRYIVPVSDATPIFYLARDIAAYKATLTWKRNEPMIADDPVQLRYDAAMTDLTAIRDGKLILTIPVQDQDSPVVYADVINPYGGTLFNPWDFGMGQPNVFDRHP